MIARTALNSTHERTSRQLSLRRRLHQFAIAKAIQTAVDVFFRFEYRATQARALWSGTERVWLGCETFLQWALFDAQIDIPWIVATSRDAPQGDEALCDAVRAELRVYWARKLSSLPRRARPHWLPLP
jgi:hypothetical protein